MLEVVNDSGDLLGARGSRGDFVEAGDRRSTHLFWRCFVLMDCGRAVRSFLLSDLS